MLAPGDFQLEAALTMDAVQVMAQGILALEREDPDKFRRYFRRGTIWFDSGDPEYLGVKCDLVQEEIPEVNPRVWTMGTDLMRTLTQVATVSCSAGVVSGNPPRYVAFRV